MLFMFLFVCDSPSGFPLKGTLGLDLPCQDEASARAAAAAAALAARRSKREDGRGGGRVERAFRAPNF